MNVTLRVAVKYTSVKWLPRWSSPASRRFPISRIKRYYDVTLWNCIRQIFVYRNGQFSPRRSHDLEFSIPDTTNKTNCRKESWSKNYWLYLLIHKIRNLPAAFRSVRRSKLSRLFSCIDRQTCVHFPPHTSHITVPGDWSPLKCTHAYVHYLL